MSEITTMRRFDSKVAVVTGGAHGIGAATVERLSAEGASVAVLDLNQPPNPEHGSFFSLVTDVSDPTAVAASITEIVRRLGAVDVLVNCAGYLRSGDIETVAWDEWKRTFAVNVDAILATTKAVLPGMLEKGKGTIVNVASVGGLFGVPGLSAYNASKGAVVNMTRNASADFMRRGVRVNCVCPGWVPTGFNDPMLVGVSDDELQVVVEASVPAGRQARPSEVAAAIAFLASDDASYISGQVLVVDGGLTASL